MDLSHEFSGRDLSVREPRRRDDNRGDACGNDLFSGEFSSDVFAAEVFSNSEVFSADISGRDRSDPGSPAAGAARRQLSCEAGVHAPASTSLKWGENGELTALDLHHVLARLLAHDQEAGLILDRFHEGAPGS